MIRRKIVDESLAKRMKKLIKQWQALLQNAATTPNGLLGGAAGSSLASTTPPVKRADPAANRTKMLQRLSNFKTASQAPQVPAPIPNELQHLPPLLPGSQAASSLPNSHTLNALPPASKPLTPSPAAVNSNKSSSPALTLSIPLSLIVKIPRNNVRLSQGSSLTGVHRSALPGHGSGGKFTESRPAVEDSAKALSLVVSIDTSLLQRGASLSQIGKSRKPETLPKVEDPLSKASQFASHFDTAVERTEIASDSERTSPMEVDRPYSVTEGSVPGIHGCTGPDGLWYEWTDAIPGQEPCVTLLPYVYVDGWDAMDQS